VLGVNLLRGMDLDERAAVLLWLSACLCK